MSGTTAPERYRARTVTKRDRASQTVPKRRSRNINQLWSLGEDAE
jgi:hypothetical protein